ncbi:MAG: hypothetical protein M3P08_16520 [Thermoproteota archaeon]|nr:hypothetical protein [Thermoproteota archaeon]
MKKLAGGRCSGCGGLPAYIARYNMGGATLIERYCETCVESERFAESLKIADTIVK